MSKAVIGLQFGDEGKGLTTDLLCSGNPISYTAYDQTNKLVVRFSGGQQAGHTVVTDEKRHVFSTFGSGTLRNVPTFWSKYCTVDPVNIIKEAESLADINTVPILFLDSKCPVTTPYEKIIQQESERALSHGTCGHGVGSTHQREEDFYHVNARDIFNKTALRLKMEQLSLYYDFKPQNQDLQLFYRSCDQIRSLMNIKLRDFETLDGHNLIFEGSQGLLLDQHIGFFPNVTRSNTGSRNILALGHEPELYLVTRAYQTRHGNGPMTNEDLKYEIADDPNETNVHNEFQGEFRKSMLDLDLLWHGISSDDYIREQVTKGKATLVVTCLDHLTKYCFTLQGEVHEYSSRDAFLSRIANVLGFRKVLISSSPKSVKMERYEP